MLSLIPLPISTPNSESDIQDFKTELDSWLQKWIIKSAFSSENNTEH